MTRKVAVPTGCATSLQRKGESDGTNRSRAKDAAGSLYSPRTGHRGRRSRCHSDGLCPDNVLFLEWTADSARASVSDGVDTFLFEHGLITLQTTQYHRSKGVMPGSERWQRQDMTAGLAQILSWTKRPVVLTQYLSQTPAGGIIGLLGMLCMGLLALWSGTSGRRETQCCSA